MFSLDGSLLRSSYADARYIDDVIVSSKAAGSPGRHITDCDNIAVNDQQPCPQYLVLNLTEYKQGEDQGTAVSKKKVA